MAAKHAMIAVDVHPMPVTFSIIGFPFFTLATFSPSVIKSISPLITTVDLISLASFFAASRASTDASVLSTPFVWTCVFCKAKISEALPRIIVGLHSLINRLQHLSRKGVAPAPTGSNMMGIFI